MLRYEQHIPANVTEGAPLIVLLHGRGSHMGDLIGLQPYLLPDAVVVCPQAPFPGAPWGYGPGWAWYRIMSPGRPEPESFSASQADLESFLTELPAHLPVKTGRLILGGFSQGGVMSMAYALRHPGQVANVINFSGFLPDHPGVQVTRESVQGTRFFWGHGTQDQMIAFGLAAEGRSTLRQAGADLRTRDYPMGHQISAPELADVVAWLSL